MRHHLLSALLHLKGAVSFVLCLLNTVVAFCLMMPVALAKLLSLRNTPVDERHVRSAEAAVGDPATRTLPIILPPDYESSGKRYPVLYLLDGQISSEMAA